METKHCFLFLYFSFLYIAVSADLSELHDSTNRTLKRRLVHDSEPNPWWYCGHPGWLYFEDNCYSSVQSQSTFFAAQFYCKSMGGALVDINSEDELNFVGNSVSCWSAHWIDGVFVYTQGDPCCSPSNWVKYDGTPIFNMSSYEYWDNWNGDWGGCLMSQYYGSWRGMNCNQQNAFVCKRPADMNAQVIGRVPKQILKDERHGCRDGWYSYNGSCYWTSAQYNISMDFFAAQLYCRYQFGDYATHLVSITSFLEAAFVYQIVMNCSHASYCGAYDASNCSTTWSGLVNIDSDHIDNTASWRWEDNQPVAVDVWQPGYPAADSWRQCGAIVNMGMWQNLGCNEEHSFVCKGAAQFPSVIPTSYSEQANSAVTVGTTIASTLVAVTSTSALRTASTTTLAALPTMSTIDTVCLDADENPCRYDSTCKKEGNMVICLCNSSYTTGAHCDVCGGLLPAASNITHLLESVYYPQLFTNTSCTWTIPFRGGYEAVQFNVTDLMIGNETTDYLEFVVGTVVTQRLVPMSNISSATVIVTTNNTLGDIVVNFLSTFGGYFTLSYETVDPCLHFPCNATNGICLSLPTGPFCECVFGFTGQYCDMPDPCAGNYCQNNGTCIPDANEMFGYHCVCVPPYSDVFCT